jgi:predicted AlkP superfamily phosphohydrolase/phosphomutase
MADPLERDMITPRKPHLLVIGVDGMDFRISSQLLAAGQLPNLAALVARGAWGPLQSTVPPVTHCAWSTLMTGKNPGKHGIFDFATEAFPQTIASRRRAMTVWQALSREGLRVGTFNLPTTYPPEQLSSFQVSGLGAPAFAADIAYPREAFEVLAGAVGSYDPFPVSIQTPKGDAAAVQQHLDVPLLGTRALLTALPCDVYMVSFQVVDWVQHARLGAELPAGGSGSLQPGGVVAQTYARVDERIGDLLREWTSDQTTVLVVSDHGGASADRLVNLERLFLDDGLMAYAHATGGDERSLSRRRSHAAKVWGVWQALRKAVPWVTRVLRPLTRRLQGRVAAYQDDLAVDWSQTVAAPWGRFGGVRLNLRGRDEGGIVVPGETEEIVARVKASLAKLTDPTTGAPVYREVLSREELYTGEYVSRGPDLVAISTEERYLTMSGRTGAATLPLLDVRRAVEVYPPSGWHSSQGVVMMAGAAIEPGTLLEGADIVDVTPTILYLLGQPVPRDMDGAPILAAIRSRSLMEQPVREGEPWSAPNSAADERTYNEEELRQLEERLRALGYL